MIKVKEVSEAGVVFGDIINLPAWESIPKEFRDIKGRWCEVVGRWFYVGLPKGTEFVPKPDVDGRKALRAVKAILASWEPKHEHKMAGVAYLLSEWFEDVEIPEEKNT